MATPNQRRPMQSPSAASSSSATPSSRPRVSSRESRGHRPRGSGAGHRHSSSVALMQQKLAEMGSYAKYYKSITQNPFQVKIRCACGRSRNMAWMFLCTYCATGTKVEKDTADTTSKQPSTETIKEATTDSKTDPATQQEPSQDDHKSSDPLQRAFLSCDLCAQKLTESYYCPHCLAAYPAHYVKLHTRCTRCVSCPVCTSALEKIVYSGSGSGSGSSSSSSAKQPPVDKGSLSAIKKKKDVYLYQCPFCFWSSNIVGLEASESDALLENLKEKLKRPVEEKTLIMNDIKKRYLNQNEDLRKEEDRIEKSKRFHTYKGGRTLFGQKGKKDGKKDSSGKAHRITLTGSSSGTSSIPMQSESTLNALEAMKTKLRQKFDENHVLKQEQCVNVEPVLDERYVTQFHLRNVSPLEHRLNDPLNQKVDLDVYVPQRFHLMTKESYKCPQRTCGKYVCKPTLRGRQANYDKRTAVLDYLPRINIRLKSSKQAMMTGATSEILVMVQNRHLYEASFKFDATCNDNDLYSTAKISCSSEWFEMDPADIHIKGGKQKDVKKANGDYVKGKEAGVTFQVTPKHYHSGAREIKFSVECLFKTKLQLKDDKSTDQNAAKGDSKSQAKKSSGSGSKKVLIETELPYILDFELGEPKTPDIAKMGLQSIEENKDTPDNKNKENNTTAPAANMLKSRASTEHLPKPQ